MDTTTLTVNIETLKADRDKVMVALGKAKALGFKEDAQALYELAIEMGGLIKKLQYFEY
jgi:hypothetical protein